MTKEEIAKARETIENRLVTTEHWFCEEAAIGWPIAISAYEHEWHLAELLKRENNVLFDENIILRAIAKAAEAFEQHTHWGMSESELECCQNMRIALEAWRGEK